MRRLPLEDGAVSAVLSMFTSFGYFGSQAAHEALLREFARVVRRGGKLVLDYLNAPLLRASLVPASEREVDGYRVRERRRIERGAGTETVVKELKVETAEGEPVEAYREEVALYDPQTVESMLAATGWSVVDRLGDYHGSPWSPGSPRALFRAERPA
jgi:hypothetical protein